MYIVGLIPFLLNKTLNINIKKQKKKLTQQIILNNKSFKINILYNNEINEVNDHNKYEFIFELIFLWINKSLTVGIYHIAAIIHINQ